MINIEAGMNNLQKVSLTSASRARSKRQRIVQKLTNKSPEDDCWHEIPRLHHGRQSGKNVDPARYGYAPERRGTTFVMDAAMAAMAGGAKQAFRKDERRPPNKI
jgi:hypothetical protein